MGPNVFRRNGDRHGFDARLAIRVAPFLLCLLLNVPCALADQVTEPDNVYPTFGVHSDAYSSDCAAKDCVYERTAGEPSDPEYPAYWTSHWTMYRVFNGYADNPPPYDHRPPPSLKEGADYQVSWGITYYDSTWSGPAGHGAMKEHYKGYCLPIFPIPNNYSCSFISLGDAAFFVTYDDRPKWMPKVCLFSPRNRPPERDFVKHLPYALADSRRLGMKVQAYAFWLGSNGKPMQVGVVPDQTQKAGILFGYDFDSEPTPDRADKSLVPYRHPQSFYFSGVPAPVPNAPIVSQNYTDFAAIRPDPAKTWSEVSGLDPAKLPQCQLFNPPAENRASRKD